MENMIEVGIRAEREMQGKYGKAPRGKDRRRDGAEEGRRDLKDGRTMGRRKEGWK
jgi:hypothetical protein